MAWTTQLIKYSLEMAKTQLPKSIEELEIEERQVEKGLSDEIDKFQLLTEEANKNKNDLDNLDNKDSEYETKKQNLEDLVELNHKDAANAERKISEIQSKLKAIRTAIKSENPYYFQSEQNTQQFIISAGGFLKHPNISAHRISTIRLESDDENAGPRISLNNLYKDPDEPEVNIERIILPHPNVHLERDPEFGEPADCRGLGHPNIRVDQKESEIVCGKPLIQVCGMGEEEESVDVFEMANECCNCKEPTFIDQCNAHKVSGELEAF